MVLYDDRLPKINLYNPFRMRRFRCIWLWLYSHLNLISKKHPNAWISTATIDLQGTIDRPYQPVYLVIKLVPINWKQAQQSIAPWKAKLVLRQFRTKQLFTASNWFFFVWLSSCSLSFLSIFPLALSFACCRVFFFGLVRRNELEHVTKWFNHKTIQCQPQNIFPKFNRIQ